VNKTIKKKGWLDKLLGGIKSGYGAKVEINLLPAIAEDIMPAGGGRFIVEGLNDNKRSFSDSDLSFFIESEFDCTICWNGFDTPLDPYTYVDAAGNQQTEYICSAVCKDKLIARIEKNRLRAEENIRKREEFEKNSAEIRKQMEEEKRRKDEELIKLQTRIASWKQLNPQPEYPALFTDITKESDIVILPLIKTLSSREFNVFLIQLLDLMTRIGWVVKENEDGLYWTPSSNLQKHRIKLGGHGGAPASPRKLAIRSVEKKVHYPLPLSVWHWLKADNKLTPDNDKHPT
jgi:hypothetical protein